jgi:hypothetical protein
MYDNGEVNLDPNGPGFVSLAGGTNFTPSPDETAPKTDEFSLTVERQLGTTIAARVTGVYSRTFNLYRTTNLLRPQSAYSTAVTRPDPGPDGRLNTTDDTGRSVTYYEYPAALAGRAFERFTRINDPDAVQRYGGFDAAVSRRMLNNWMFTASFSMTHVNNPLVNGLTPNAFNETEVAAADDPNAEIFAAQKTWEWQARVSGAYRLPWDMTVSANYQNQSGTPWARQVVFTGGVLSSITLRVEPIGTRRLPSINTVDVRVEKALPLGGARKLQLRANVYNITNTNTVTTLGMVSGSAYNLPSAITPPRIVELSLGFTF